MKAPELIDAAVGARVLVYGSLPPDGRDLDLLVREPERVALDACLTEAGFVRQGDEWARFESCSVEVVETTSAASWDLPSDELTAVFDEALEIDGLHNVVRPCAHHNLLILARRVVHSSGVLDAKRRARLERALAEAPDAWARARERAEGWRACIALDALEQAWRTDSSVSAVLRAAAKRERRRAHLNGKAGLSRVSTAVRQLPRPHRGAVVAFSGLDGAGKSSQATALAETLQRLGYDAIVVRTRITWEDSLWTIAGPIKRLLAPPLRLLTSLRAAPTPGKPPPAREQPLPDGRDSDEQDRWGETGPATHHPVTSVREASSFLTNIWTLIITLANASSQWKLMRRQLLRGGIVICDRYTLDSIVELRYSYGTERSFHGARAALSRLYPTPVRAYFLDVPPRVALERKGEWGIRWLTEHRDLYLQECERLGVRPLDGERARSDLCAEIAADVWLSGI